LGLLGVIVVDHVFFSPYWVLNGRTMTDRNDVKEYTARNIAAGSTRRSSTTTE
jgi:hypothetical protein